MDSPTPTQAIGAHTPGHKIDAHARTQRDALCLCVCTRVYVCVSCYLSHTHSLTHTSICTQTDRLLPAILLSLPPAPASPFIPGLTNSISASAPSVHSQHSVNMAGFFRWISVGHAFHLFLHYEPIYIVVLIEQEYVFDVSGVSALCLYCCNRAHD